MAGGPEKLRELRDSGFDRAYGGKAGKKRGEHNRKHQLEIPEWENHRPDALKIVDFEKDIFPGYRPSQSLRFRKELGFRGGIVRLLGKAMFHTTSIGKAC